MWHQCKVKIMKCFLVLFMILQVGGQFWRTGTLPRNYWCLNWKILSLSLKNFLMQYFTVLLVKMCTLFISLVIYICWYVWESAFLVANGSFHFRIITLESRPSSMLECESGTMAEGNQGVNLYILAGHESSMY